MRSSRSRDMSPRAAARPDHHGSMRVSDEVMRSGECVPYSTLIGRGATEHHIRAAVASQSIIRVRQGWYGRGLSAERTAAARAGGAVTCVSALRLHGAWTMPDDAVHVRVPTPRVSHVQRGIRVHRSVQRSEVGGIDDVRQAMGHVIQCASTEAAIVALDSALNRGLTTWTNVTEVCQSRKPSLLQLLDPASESGIETLARLRLRRLRIRVRSQVVIDGVGRVDLLVGDRLVLEMDGRAWHDRPGDFESDRRRDRALVSMGYLVMRASYAQVMGEWASIESQILSLVRDRRHLRRGQSRKLRA